MFHFMHLKIMIDGKENLELFDYPIHAWPAVIRLTRLIPLLRLVCGGDYLIFPFSVFVVSQSELWLLPLNYPC